MVDTERFQLGPELVHRVTTLAASIAVERDGRVNPLQVATYMPIDVESVARILESVEDDYDLERFERGGICYFRFQDPDERVPSDLEIEAGDHLDDRDAVQSCISSLKSDGDWERKVREQHELIRWAAEADASTLELSYFLDRSDVSASRIQSILNDFGAEGHVDHEFEKDGEEPLEYSFPELEYPDDRFDTNMDLLEVLGASEPSNPVWSWIGAVALLLLVVVILIRFYAV